MYLIIVYKVCLVSIVWIPNLSNGSGVKILNLYHDLKNGNLYGNYLLSRQNMYLNHVLIKRMLVSK